MSTDKEINPGRPIEAIEAVDLIEHYQLLSDEVSQSYKPGSENEEELKLFVGSKHNTHVFTKKEIMNMFEKSPNAEYLAVVHGAHTPAHHAGKEHSAGAKTLVAMAVEQILGDGDINLKTSKQASVTPAVEYPWLYCVKPALDDGQILLAGKLCLPEAKKEL